MFSQWLTLLFFYLHLFLYCHIIGYSVFSPQCPSTHMWCQVGQTLSWKFLLPKNSTSTNSRISSFCQPPSEISVSSLQFSYEWLIVMALPFSSLTQKPFLKSARFTIRTGKEQGMFIAFNSSSAVKEETKQMAASFCL